VNSVPTRFESPSGEAGALPGKRVELDVVGDREVVQGVDITPVEDRLVVAARDALVLVTSPLSGLTDSVTELCRLRD